MSKEEFVILANGFCEEIKKENEFLEAVEKFCEGVFESDEYRPGLKAIAKIIDNEFLSEEEQECFSVAFEAVYDIYFNGKIIFTIKEGEATDREIIISSFEDLYNFFKGEWN